MSHHFRLGHRYNSRNQKAFSVIEMLIATLLLCIFLSAALPAMSRFLFLSQEAEGTRMLLKAYEEQKRALENNHYLSDINELNYRPSTSTHFNLITRNIDSSENIASSLWHLKSSSGAPLYPRVRAPLNRFGNRSVAGSKSDRFLMGAEGKILDSKFLHVLGIDEKGQLYRICNAWLQSKDEGSQYYEAFTQTPVICEISTKASH